MFTRVLIGFAAIALVGLFAARAVSAQDNAERVDGVYRSDAFGFSITMPSKWYSLPAPGAPAVRCAEEELRTGDRKLDPTKELFVQKCVFLLGRYPAGTVGNPSFVAVLNWQDNGVVLAPMVSSSIKSFYLAKPASKLTDDVHDETFGGGKFSVVGVSYEDPSVGTMHVRAYTTMIRDFSLSITMQYMNDEDLAAMKASLSTIKFK